MARRSEIVALIRRSKTDKHGEGASSDLSKQTIQYLRIWLEVAAIQEGAILRHLWRANRVGERLGAEAISNVYKCVAQWVGWPEKQVKQVSGHSIRVGATQDLLSLNIDLASVMQAGRWKSRAMPMRYGEHIIAAISGMAQAAELQRRNN